MHFRVTSIAFLEIFFRTLDNSPVADSIAFPKIILMGFPRQFPWIFQGFFFYGFLGYFEESSRAILISLRVTSMGFSKGSKGSFSWLYQGHFDDTSRANSMLFQGLPIAILGLFDSFLEHFDGCSGLFRLLLAILLAFSGLFRAIPDDFEDFSMVIPISLKGHFNCYSRTIFMSFLVDYFYGFLQDHMYALAFPMPFL